MLAIIIIGLILGFLTMPLGMAYPFETAVVTGSLFIVIGVGGYIKWKNLYALISSCATGVILILFGTLFLSTPPSGDQRYIATFFVYLSLLFVILCMSEKKNLKCWGPLIALATIITSHCGFVLFIFGILGVKFG